MATVTLGILGGFDMRCVGCWCFHGGCRTFVVKPVGFVDAALVDRDVAINVAAFGTALVDNATVLLIECADAFDTSTGFG